MESKNVDFFFNAENQSKIVWEKSFVDTGRDNRFLAYFQNFLEAKQLHGIAKSFTARCFAHRVLLFFFLLPFV